METLLLQVWQGISTNPYDMAYRSKDGTARFTVSRLYPVRNSEGRTLECVFANTDSYPGAFSQIITNFIMNSLTHGFDRNTSGEIIIEVYLMDDRFQMRYSDNGRGISEEEQTRIFEPFYTTKRGQGGSGLGLHIVYNLVTQRLNGHIECKSTLGEGTTFIIQMSI